MTIPSSKLKAPTRPKHTEAHMINHPKFQSISRGCTHIHPQNGGTFIEFQDVSRSKKLEWGLLPQGSLQAHPPHGSRLDDDGFPAAEHLATFDGMISCSSPLSSTDWVRSFLKVIGAWRSPVHGVLCHQICLFDSVRLFCKCYCTIANMMTSI